MDWAGPKYEVDFLNKCWFGGGSCFSKIILLSGNGVGVGKWHFCRHRKKVRCRKWRWRNLNLLCDRFWNYFLEFPADFLYREGGLGVYRILSLYIGSSPYFPNWSGPIFPHGPIFPRGTPDHPPLAANMLAWNRFIFGGHGWYHFNQAFKMQTHFAN